MSAPPPMPVKPTTMPMPKQASVSTQSIFVKNPMSYLISSGPLRPACDDTPATAIRYSLSN